MYAPIWNAVLSHISAKRMKIDVREFFEYSRWSSFDKINALALVIADKMKTIGMEDVRLIEFPADGKTSYGGWVMPQAYDVQEARLQVLDGECRGVLADYRRNPTSLMLYSMSTPADGINTDLVVADTIDAMTPERVSAQLVLTSGIGVEFSQAAMQAGAHGIVSDCRNGHRFFKSNHEVDASNEWHNYTIPPWADPGKGFGFSISPEKGRRLRCEIEDGGRIQVNALVRTRQYDGVLPVISGCLKGESSDEILLTGHYDEYGADDNCSQIAVSLEVCRSIKAMVEAGELPPLKRTIRILFPMEVRGFNALIQDENEIRHMVAGLNIDTVGTDQIAATSCCTLSDSLTPSFAEEFAAELLWHISEQDPLFRWRRTDAEMIDNVFGEPMIGAPIPQIWHFSASHHLETDKPDRISRRMLTNMARVAATYCAFLENAGLTEAIWLAELSAELSSRRFRDIVRKSFGSNGDGKQSAKLHAQLENARERCRQKPGTAGRLVPSVSLQPTTNVSDEQRHQLVGGSQLVPIEQFNLCVADLHSQIQRDYTEADSLLRRRLGDQPENGIDRGTPSTLLSTCVPIKLFRGFFGFEDLNSDDLAFVRDVLEIPAGWGAPMWLQHALMYSNGKRTAGDIATLLERHHNSSIELARLEKTFAFLEKQGAVSLRPYLTQSEVNAAVIKAGVCPGDVLLGHFALSWFGYIEGGADGLINTLIEILGPEGTLVMPTFSFSWLGRMPFDPHSTPSRVGAVTDHFWRLPGVLRSSHPTHSFAACGKYAEELLVGHDHTQSPLSMHGPLGRIEGLNGKILMFAPLSANTSMHVGEYRAGIPMLELICPIMENGERREVLVPECPWHVNFTPAYELLYARKQILEAELGRNTVRTMLCRDAIATQEEVMREMPEHLLLGCDCAYCKALLEFCKARG